MLCNNRDRIKFYNPFRRYLLRNLFNYFVQYFTSVFDPLSLEDLTVQTTD